MDPPVDEIDLRSTIVEVLSTQLESADAEALAETILGAISAPAFVDRLAGAIAAATRRAWDQYALRDDLYENPGTGTVSAQVAATAVARVLTGERKPPTQHLSPRQAEGLLRSIEYRGWQFSLVRLSDESFGVEVTASTTDVYRDGRTFALSRMAPVRDDVLEAAFNAVMAIEQHEARERFFVAGRRPFDPHDDFGFDRPHIGLQPDASAPRTSEPA